jgi:hypothetical protein
MNIYDILKTKPHNIHYLNRYYRFITDCRSHNKKLDYSELHHICPKSKDLFPEYKSLKQYPENGIRLSARQHFIAHYMLFRAYGGRQTYAFNAMCNQVNNPNQNRDYKINSKMYSKLKAEMSNQSHPNRGTAVYQDKDGNRMRISTTDPRVISGDLVSTTKGHSHAGWKHSEENKQKMRDRERTPEHCKNISKAKIGKTQPLSANIARSESLKGRVPWNKDKAATEEHKKNNAAAQTGLKRKRRVVDTNNADNLTLISHQTPT